MPPRTLILYLYAHDALRQRNKAVDDNLRFFVRNGLDAASAVDAFSFSLLLSGSSAYSMDLPPRPNVIVHSVARAGSRGQMSQYKAFLDSPEQYPGCETSRPTCRTGGGSDAPASSRADEQGTVLIDWRRFERFVLVSDVVRGPFLPPYLPVASWPDLFTAPLSDSTKLVGATVACEDCGKDERRCKTMLHIESTVLATDQTGLRILLKRWVVHSLQPNRSKALDYKDGKWAEIFDNEIGGPVAIRNAGYNFAATTRYWRGHDVRCVPTYLPLAPAPTPRLILTLVTDCSRPTNIAFTALSRAVPRLQRHFQKVCAARQDVGQDDRRGRSAHQASRWTP